MRTKALAFVLIIAIAILVEVSGHSRRKGKVGYKRYEKKKFSVYKWSKLVPAEESKSIKIKSFGGVQVGRVTLHKTSRHTGSLLRIWEAFKQLYNKTYEGIREEQKRLQTFIENAERIENHNNEYQRGIHSYNLSMNEFGDLTPHEFVRTMNGFKRNYGDSLAKPHSSLFLEPHNVRLPDHIDWREHGYVTPVKNQGHCGSCWSFSATGALEGQHKRKNGTLTSLSEQNLVDCSGPFGNQGCNGGLMDQAFQYIKTNDGIDTETSYPYEARDDRCRFVKGDIGADDTGFMDIPKGDERKLQAAVGTVGPVSVAIDASHSSFQFYDYGIYYEPNCSPTALDHGVLVVGYGQNSDGIEYWTVKNSWGPSWGMDGYIQMARNRDNMCGIASSASFPLV